MENGGHFCHGTNMRWPNSKIFCSNNEPKALACIIKGTIPSTIPRICRAKPSLQDTQVRVLLQGVARMRARRYSTTCGQSFLVYPYKRNTMAPIARPFNLDTHTHTHEQMGLSQKPRVVTIYSLSEHVSCLVMCDVGVSVSRNAFRTSYKLTKTAITTPHAIKTPPVAHVTIA